MIAHQQVAHAIENQCRTFLSFNAGGEKDMKFISDQHSNDVEPANLMTLSPYRIYMRRGQVRRIDPLGQGRCVPADRLSDRLHEQLQATTRRQDDVIHLVEYVEEQRELTRYPRSTANVYSTKQLILARWKWKLTGVLVDADHAESS